VKKSTKITRKKPVGDEGRPGKKPGGILGLPAENVGTNGGKDDGEKMKLCGGGGGWKGIAG